MWIMKIYALALLKTLVPQRADGRLMVYEAQAKHDAIADGVGRDGSAGGWGGSAGLLHQVPIPLFLWVAPHGVPAPRFPIHREASFP